MYEIRHYLTMDGKDPYLDWQRSTGQPNETTFQLTLTYLRQKYSPSKGHESKFWT
uniref:Uncharacterized protein n=1 Tax=Candidatus Kentrum sp. UNK TaxID=2126344 RepID=A0A451A1U1_9GAMM|nr:MAG: hypothetical protein BECKUNK1418G_GA0071005_100972 [Candidatus Kentron sp. UNK]VFK72330.1 MAG: hypothetical protein BECKUNK1418H_GA0071006_11088 [Candidatus Kentron sp. UNK]